MLRRAPPRPPPGAVYIGGIGTISNICDFMERILILDFGSQYTQLIARRIRELHVFCEIHPYTYAPQVAAQLADGDLRGVILSGSPCSVREADAPSPDLSGILGKVPVLGICYGAQLLAHQAGGEVLPATIRELSLIHI